MTISGKPKTKSKMLGFRLDLNLFSSLQELLSKRNISLTEAVENSLRYFISHPNEVLTQERLDGVVQLMSSPESSLSRLKETGISSHEELIFMTSMIQQAYHKYPFSYVRSIWVSNLVHVFSLLYPLLSSKSLKELSPYFQSTFPLPSGDRDLNNRVSRVIEELRQKPKVTGGSADMIARCFLVIVRDGEFELSDKTLKEIKTLLEPWCFWVGRRALSQRTEGVAFDIPIPSGEVLLPDGDSFQLKRDLVQVGVNLSQLPSHPFGTKTEFSCCFQFSKASIDLNATTLITIADALAILRLPPEWKGQSRSVATVGSITLYSPHPHGHPCIKVGNVRIYPDLQEWSEFVSLFDELLAREDVQADLVKEYVEVYGAL